MESGEGGMGEREVRGGKWGGRERIVSVRVNYRRRELRPYASAKVTVLSNPATCDCLYKTSTC